MKIKKTAKSFKKTLFITTLTVAIFASSYAVFAYTQQIWPFSDSGQDLTETRSNSGTPEDVAAVQLEDAKAKQDFLDQEVAHNKINPPTNSSESTKPDITIEAYTQDSLLVIVTNLSTVSSGECILKLQKDEMSIIKTAKVIFAPVNSTCEGFSVNQSELDSGSWVITLSVKTDSNTLSKTINYTI